MADEFEVLRDGQATGPFTAEQLQEMALDGRLTPADRARAVGGDAWLPLKQCLRAARGAPAESAPPPEPPVEAPPDARYEVLRDGKVLGPITTAQAQRLIAEGKLSPRDQLRTVGTEAWAPAKRFRHLLTAAASDPSPADPLPPGLDSRAEEVRASAPAPSPAPPLTADPPPAAVPPAPAAGAVVAAAAAGLPTDPGAAPAPADVLAPDEGKRLTADENDALLAERARLLARVPDEERYGAGDSFDILTFSLAAERYGVGTGFVRELARLSDFTPVPGAPEFIVGVVNFRGEILAVVDLRKFFGMPTVGLPDLSWVVVLGQERPLFGLLADEVHEVSPVREDEVLSTGELAVSVRTEYLRGVTREALVVLDGESLLNSEQLRVEQADAF